MLGEAAKIERHRSLVFESRGASLTAVAMAEGFLACAGIDDLFASYLIDDVFKVLAIHAKHLDDDSSSLLDALSPPDVRSLSIKMVRARCNLDLSVPIAQPSTAAASV